MATLNRATKELTCKIVYYGPGWGGKTTNLQKIHTMLPTGTVGRLTSVANREDRTLFFDLLPLDLGKIGDYYVKFQLYTVPGQAQYDATRRVVLKGVDGLVMVFDSDPQRESANVSSIAKLEENLALYGLKPTDVPTVYQYNKRDLPKAMDIQTMKERLNPEGYYPETEAVAIQGIGVMETVRKVSELVFAKIEKQLPSRMGTGTGTRPPMKSGTNSRSTFRRTKPEPVKPPAEMPKPEPEPPKPLCIHQFCDLRFSGFYVGHALLELAEKAADGKADISAQMELYPIVGRPRTRISQFWKASEESKNGKRVEIYANVPGDGPATALLKIVRREGQPPQAAIEMKARLGRLRLVPEGDAPLGS